MTNDYELDSATKWAGEKKHFPPGGCFEEQKQQRVYIRSERFSWPGQTTQFREYVRSCRVCQRCNRRREQVRAPSKSVPIGGPFEML